MRKLLLPAIVLSLFIVMTAAAMAEKPPKPAAPSGTVIVYYFRNNYRCPSCKKIETYTQETVTTRFADDINKGVVTFKMVNVDEPANKHFIKDYKIFTKQVVLVEMKNGVQTRWKNLDKIWDLLGDQAKFSAYVENEIRNFKGGS